ncbi:MAG: hypothetical protein LBT38_09160 [Deltaproteobacteria bacterium]|nr:hypothetical protein [Deltaproteobacteria bacterium]
MLRKVIYVAMALIFLPFGYGVLEASFNLASPHIFVMFLFSGSLMILLGLTGIVGLIAELTKKSDKTR